MEIRITRNHWGANFPEFSVTAQPTDSIKDVKLKIQDQEGFPFDQLHLYNYNPQTRKKIGPLEDDKTLQHYSINDKDWLYLVVGIRLFFKDVVGYRLPIVVKPNAQIKEVKEKIEVPSGVLPSNQTIIRAGIELEDEKTLQDYGIKYDDLIHMIERNPSKNSDE